MGLKILLHFLKILLEAVHVDYVRVLYDALVFVERLLSRQALVNKLHQTRSQDCFLLGFFGLQLDLHTSRRLTPLHVAAHHGCAVHRRQVVNGNGSLSCVYERLLFQVTISLRQIGHRADILPEFGRAVDIESLRRLPGPRSLQRLILRYINSQQRVLVGFELTSHPAPKHVIHDSVGGRGLN